LESNWRFNVWAEGLANSNVALFARTVADPDFAISKEVRPHTVSEVWWAWDALEQIWQRGHVRVITDPSERFPYGWVVDPDH